MNTILTYIKQNKIKLSVAAFLTSYAIYNITKHSNKIRSFITFITTIKENYKQQSLLNNEILYINTTQNTSKLHSYIINSLNTYLKINETKLLLQKQTSTTSATDKISNWEILKEKVFTAFYASTYLLKFYHLIEITHIALLQNYCKRETITQATADKILNELWQISNKILERLLTNIKNKIQSQIEKVKINHQFNQDKCKELLIGIHNSLFNCSSDNKNDSNEISFNIFEPFYDEVNNLIENDYQKQLYIDNDIKGINNDNYTCIMIYNWYYNIISSELFGNVLYEIFNCDIQWKVELLLQKVNTTNNTTTNNQKKITLPKIITALDEIIYKNTSIINNDNSSSTPTNISEFNNNSNSNIIQLQNKINLITKEYFLTLKSFPF